MTVQTTAQFLDGLDWREASTLIITVWDAVTFPGSYHDYQARCGEGATMWSVPSVKYDERSAADFARDIAAGKAPGHGSDHQSQQTAVLGVRIRSPAVLVPARRSGSRVARGPEVKESTDMTAQAEEILTYVHPHGNRLRYRPIFEEEVARLGEPVVHRFVMISYDDRCGVVVRDYACTTCVSAPHGKSIEGRTAKVAASEDGLGWGQQ